MQQIPREQVLKRIVAENPWWREPHSIQSVYAGWSPRAYLNLFLPLVTKRTIRRAVVLMGPRRVGKTVMIHHAIQKLLDNGIPPEKICYVSVDNPIYVNSSLERLLELFGEATGTDYTSAESFVFFDEIQYLRNWEVHLKVLVDSYPSLKCIASGSAAAALRLKSDESGAGRFTDFLLPPLTFYEYLDMLHEEDLVTRGNGIFSTEDIDLLNKRFIHYLNFGGYPEVVLSPEIQADPARFIKSDIIDKVLLRDLPSLYGIHNIQELNFLFTTLAFNTAQEVSLEQLSMQSGVAKNTLKRYIEYLEAAFLLRTVHRVDRNARSFQRANYFKVYLTNPSMRTALFSALGADDSEIGCMVETGIFSQWFHSGLHAVLRYARWTDGEVDIVNVGDGNQVRWAVEVKWSDRYVKRPGDLSGLIDFCHRNNLNKIVVTTRTKVAKETLESVEIEFRPAALYCFAVGYNLVNSAALRMKDAIED
jgi:hypothetical protein